MKKVIIVAALAAIVSGCQTRITAEKHPEQLLPVYGCSGTNVFVKGYERASGGWYATARSPLWATEELRGLDISVGTNGTVSLQLAEYNRDLSTNAVMMTEIMVKGAVELTDRICAAVTASGQAKASAKAAKALAAQFISKGGDPAKASVSCADGLCTVTDGTTCVGGLCSE